MTDQSGTESVPLLPDQTSDEQDTAWGDEPAEPDGVQRLLAEKPPHHVD